MTKKEALEVKKGDILISLTSGPVQDMNEEFIVMYLHKSYNGLQFDTTADLKSLRTGKDIVSKLENFEYSDVTADWRTSRMWTLYIKTGLLPESDQILELIAKIKEYDSIGNTKIIKSHYDNEIKASEILLDIIHGHRDRLGEKIIKQHICN